MSKKILGLMSGFSAPARVCIILMENYLLLERRAKILNALKEY